MHIQENEAAINPIAVIKTPLLNSVISDYEQLET